LPDDIPVALSIELSKLLSVSNPAFDVVRILPLKNGSFDADGVGVSTEIECAEVVAGGSVLLELGVLGYEGTCVEGALFALETFVPPPWFDVWLSLWPVPLWAT
jgi:hypothetical protein